MRKNIFIVVIKWEKETNDSGKFVLNWNEKIFSRKTYLISFADIHYKIRIETGQSGIDANVILCIFGEEETTTNLPLTTTKDGSEAKFEKNSNLEFDLQTADVGKVWFRRMNRSKMLFDLD